MSRFGVVAALCLLLVVALSVLSTTVQAQCSCTSTCGTCSTPSLVYGGQGACGMDYMVLASNLVQNNEGCVLGCYTDSLGNPTVGVGAEISSNVGNLQNLGYDISSLENCSQCMNNNDVQSLLLTDLGAAQSCAQSLLSNFNSLPATAQAVAIDMSFNLGCGGFSQFVNTLNSINNSNWSGAVSGMQNSLWCNQVGNRCSVDSQMMSSSQYCSSAGTTQYLQKVDNSSSSNRALVLGLSISLSIAGAAAIAVAVVFVVVLMRRRRQQRAAAANNTYNVQLLPVGGQQF